MKRDNLTGVWKRRLIAAFLAFFLMSEVTACGKDAGSGETAEETPEEEPSGEKTAEGESAPGETADVTAGAEASASLKEEAAEETAVSGQLPPWVLCETEDFSILMKDAVDPNHLYANFLITIINNSDYDLSFGLTDIVVNDVYRLSEEDYGSTGPHETRTRDLYSFNNWLTVFEKEIGGMHKISLHFSLHIRNAETYEDIDSLEKECEIILPDDYEPSMIFEPIYSMKTEEQVLFEDEERLIELRSMGRSPDTIDLYAITGILHFFNKSDHSIPVDFMGLRVNGFYIEPTSFGGGTLAAGSERYILFLCKKEDLDKAGITAIKTVELLVLSSEEENTGAFNASGGSWYPVSLSLTGEEDADDSEDVLVYEDEFVSIALRSKWLDWHDITYDDPYGYYHWLLVVTNKSEENIELALMDITVDGVLQERYSSDNVYPTREDLGSNSKTVLELQKRTSENKAVPQLSFRVQERTFGGGRLLYDSDVKIVLEGS